jgi:hypothetical protein
MSERQQAPDQSRHLRAVIAQETYEQGGASRVMRAVEDYVAKLAVQAPAVGVSPQPVQRFDLVSVNFAYTSDHEMERSDAGEWVRFHDVFPPAPVFPVEPTPEPPQEPAPCVWREKGHIYRSECRGPMTIYEFSGTVGTWSFCPYCGYPLTIDGRTP